MSCYGNQYMAKISDSRVPCMQDERMKLRSTDLVVDVLLATAVVENRKDSVCQEYSVPNGLDICQTHVQRRCSVASCLMNEKRVCSLGRSLPTASQGLGPRAPSTAPSTKSATKGPRDLQRHAQWKPGYWSLD